jgi:hypothetical protein
MTTVDDRTTAVGVTRARFFGQLDRRRHLVAPFLSLRC